MSFVTTALSGFNGIYKLYFLFFILMMLNLETRNRGVLEQWHFGAVTKRKTMPAVTTRGIQTLLMCQCNTIMLKVLKEPMGCSGAHWSVLPKWRTRGPCVSTVPGLVQWFLLTAADETNRTASLESIQLKLLPIFWAWHPWDCGQVSRPPELGREGKFATTLRG